MDKKTSNRTRKITLSLTPEEFTKIERQWNASTCRTRSDYVRRHLLRKAIITTYRNRSMDDLIEELARLRVELNHIGNKFSEAVKCLHTLSRIGEFRQWLISYEVEKKIFFNKVDEIKKQILKITERW